MAPLVVSSRTAPVWAAAMSALPLLFGCGGATTTNATGWELTLEEFSTSAKSVAAGPSTAPTALSFQWSVRYTPGIALYAFYVHLVPKNAGGSGGERSEANRIFGHNCGAPAGLYGCDMTGQQPCTYATTNNRDRNRISCTVAGVVTRVDVRPGDYAALGRACFFDADLNEVCRQSTLFVELGP